MQTGLLTLYASRPANDHGSPMQNLDAPMVNVRIYNPPLPIGWALASLWVEATVRTAELGNTPQPSLPVDWLQASLQMGWEGNAKQPRATHANRFAYTLRQPACK